MLRTLLPVFLAVFTWGCEMPSPQAPAQPIGEYPNWGQNFAKPEATAGGTDSLLSGTGPAPSNAPNQAALSGGGGSTTPNMKNTFSAEDWANGDPELGRQVFLNQCARCHGANGKGGELPGIGTVPTLADAAWQQRVTEKDIASTIAHGKGAMPSFMGKLEKSELAGVIAYIRTLK